MTITGVFDIVPVVDGEKGDDAVVYSLQPTLSSFNLDAARTLELECTVRLYKTEGAGLPVAQSSGNMVVRGFKADGTVVNSSVSTSTNGQITFLSSAGSNQCVRFRVDYVENSQSITNITIPVVLAGKRGRFRGYWNQNDTYLEIGRAHV